MPIKYSAKKTKVCNVCGISDQELNGLFSTSPSFGKPKMRQNSTSKMISIVNLRTSKPSTKMISLF